jgi:quercetin dioxygenase-like cupin family protein
LVRGYRRKRYFAFHPAGDSYFADDPAEATLEKGCGGAYASASSGTNTMMASGLLRVELDGKDVLLRPGDILLIPSNAPHLFEALEDSVETDVFTPPREDLMPKPTAG